MNLDTDEAAHMFNTNWFGLYMAFSFFFSHYKDFLSPTEHLINLGKDKWVMCWSLDWFKLLTALQHMGILTFANANLHIWNVFGVLLYFYYNRSLELMLLLIFKIYQLFV